MKNLRELTIRSGAIKLAAQGASFFLRLGSLMILGRLLNPKDFGLVGMVTAMTGVLSLFRDFGLSTVTVQRADVTEAQISTLFWVNLLVGAILSAACLAGAPIVASFYHEPRLLAITLVVGLGFLLNASGVQHMAILQRQMRFAASTAIEMVALAVSIAMGVGMAMTGYGYWALVSIAVVPSAVTTAGAWLMTRWIPGLPRRNVGLRSMMHFGGALTLNGLIVYVAYNFEKILLGRFWGADAIGLYGRAYQLINIPTENLNTAIGGVAFSALSRLQNDPDRLKRYFLKGYSLILTLTLPITILCALFADDIIAVVLGPKWGAAVPIFRLLSPTILIFALINPLTWLIFSLGMVRRSLNVALVLAPLVITGYAIGLPHGPVGVAFAYSAVMILWVVPHIAWFVHGTVISLRDVALAISRPLLSGLIAAVPAIGVQFLCARWTPIPRLAVGGLASISVYLFMLLHVMGQRAFFVELLRGLRTRPGTAEEPDYASA
jgi:PST family polysaccharide transporter